MKQTMRIPRTHGNLSFLASWHGPSEDEMVKQAIIEAEASKNGTGDDLTSEVLHMLELN